MLSWKKVGVHLIRIISDNPGTLEWEKELGVPALSEAGEIHRGARTPLRDR